MIKTVFCLVMLFIFISCHEFTAKKEMPDNSDEAGCNYIFEYDGYNSFKTVAGSSDEPLLNYPGVDSFYDGEHIILAYSKDVDGSSNIFIKKVDISGNVVMPEKNVTNYTAENGEARVPKITAYGNTYHLVYVYNTHPFNTASLQIMYLPLDKYFNHIAGKPPINISKTASPSHGVFPTISKEIAAPHFIVTWMEGAPNNLLSSELHVMMINAQEQIPVEESEIILQSPDAGYITPVVYSQKDDRLSLYCLANDEGSQLVLWDGHDAKKVLEAYPYSLSSICGIPLATTPYYIYTYDMYFDTDEADDNVTIIYVTYMKANGSSVMVRKFKLAPDRFIPETDAIEVNSSDYGTIRNVAIDGNKSGIVIALQTTEGNILGSNVASSMGYKRLSKDLLSSEPFIYNRYYSGNFLFRSPINLHYTDDKRIIMQYGTEINGNISLELTVTESCVD